MASNRICWIFLSLLLTSVACGSSEEEEPSIVPASTIEQLSPMDFASRLSQTDTFILLDLRTPTEFEEGHLKGARNLNFFAPDFAANLQKLDREIPVFIYSQDGKRSGKALAEFRRLRFLEVYELKGGYEAMSL